MTHRVSVVIPTLNGAAYLNQALESVQAQTSPPFEVIVIDSGSNDGTSEIARAHPVVSRVLEIRSNNIGDGYNAGLHTASGNLIAFLAQDDFWTPNKLRWQLEMLEVNPQALLVIGQVRWFLEDGISLPTGARAEWLNGCFAARIPETLLARREAFERVGDFNVRFNSGMDSDWFMRAQDLGLGMLVVNQIVLYKRLHQHNTSITARDGNRQLLRMLRESVLRKRAQSQG